MNSSDSNPQGPRSIPWATILAAALAVVVYFLPTGSETLVYDRRLVDQGEWWRVLTCHWVHFTPSHLGWNLAVLLPAGIWAERVAPVRSRLLYLVAAVLIGGVLHFFEPMLMRYGGLSGIAAGLVAFLAIVQLRQGASDRWFWRAVLGLLALKIVVEVLLGSPLLARFPDPSMRSVALAHLAGVVAALLTLRIARHRSTTAL